ncbi:RNA-binding protein [Halobacteriales archaeon QS_4_62_28]|nr:MAG: RNA-binding protein [Halobacteriales archaeon QS_4_62_28]
MTVRIRGIYTTALTELFSDDPGVVQPSGPIAERFGDDFPHDPATVTVETTDDRQGIGVVGDEATVESVCEQLSSLARDTFVWQDPTPRGGIYAGEVTETLGSGAIVGLGDSEGYLPYSTTDRRVETGDCLRVQVEEPRPPWSDDRPVLDTTIRADGSLLSLVRGGTSDHGGPELADILPTDPRKGWGSSWHHTSDDADLDALGDALNRVNDRARRIDAAFEDATAPTEAAPARYVAPEATAWVWFGRESRFALDDLREAVTRTMPGHHRIKAGSRSASAGVDLAEAVADGFQTGEQDVPFAAVTNQFGPAVGDTVRLDHGKPDGRMYTLGDAEVQSVDADGTVTVERAMSPGGTYDALGVDRQAGDVATTKVTEGRWWYPTVYNGADGTRRGTYVNVCTPVEVFPDAIRYVDLHVDVVKHADGRVERVDDDELDAAVDAGHISEALAEKARDVAAAVKHGLE